MTIVDDDPYLWLEDITSEQALDWVRQNSETTLAELSGERFERMRAEALEVADFSDRIPGVNGEVSPYTTSGLTPGTRGGYGGGPLSKSTAETRPTGMSSSTSTRWLPRRTRIGSGREPMSSNPSTRAR